MVAIAALIDSAWTGSSLQFTATREGLLMGIEPAVITVVGGVTKASATIDMSGYGAGNVDLTLVMTTTGAIAWVNRITLDATGAASEDADATIAKFKADLQLGTADGGLVSNVGKIPRAATAVTDGAAQSKRLVNESGDTLQQVHEILDGDA